MVLGVLLAVATVTGLAIRGQVVEQRKTTHAAGLVQAVLNADTAQVPAIVGEMAEYRKWTDPLLREANDQGSNEVPAETPRQPGPVAGGPSQVDYLYGRLLDADPHEVPVIRDALAPHKDELLDKLWAVVEKPEKGKESQRLRAAAALAKYDPESEKWAKASALVVNDLVLENPVYLGQWSEAFRPVKNRLARSVVRHLSRSPTGARRRNASGDEHAGRLRRRPAAGPGRSAHGRRREAVRRHLSEIQGTGRARTAGADRRDRHETARRPALLGRATGRSWRSGRRMRRWHS